MSDLINLRKKKWLHLILRYFVLVPFIMTLILLLLKWFFLQDVSRSYYGGIIGLWIGILIRLFLIDLEPNYAYNIYKTKDNLILDLINPIGKSRQLKISNEEIEKIYFGKRTKWKAFDKIYIQRNGIINNYKIIDKELTYESLKFQVGEI